MHTFPDYHAPSSAEIVRLVWQSPFAIAVTSQDGPPLATHVPIVPPPGLAQPDTLVGQTLWGHMGRANRHWRRMRERPDLLLVHSTSHAYVSASHYQRDPSVPTVDYAAVHLTGRVRLVEDDATSLAIVRQTVRHLETLRSERLGVEPWSDETSVNEFRRILGGIVAFEIEITSQQAMFKLSQNQDSEVRARIAAEETAPGCPHADVANKMALFDGGFVRGQHEPPVERDEPGKQGPHTEPDSASTSSSEHDASHERTN